MEEHGVDPAEIRDRLLTAGERLGWQFRDRHALWRHWTTPRPERGGALHPIVRYVLIAGLCLYAVVAALVTLAVWAFSLVKPTTHWPEVIGAWLVFLVLAAVYALLTRGVPSLGHAALVARWERERDAHNATERARVDSMDEWGAVRTLPGTRRIDVFGGEHQGWAAFLTTFGCSLLAEQSPVVLLDITQVGVGAELCQVARQAGIDSHVELLPDQAGVSTLLAGLSPTDVKDVLVEAIHGDDPGHDRDERLLDDRILTSICAELRPNPTLARIHGALRQMLGEPGLHPSQYDRLQRLEAYLAHLSELPTAESGAPAPVAATPGLTCFAVTQRGSQLATELIVDLLGQWLIRSLKNVRPGQAPRTVIIAGADSLRAPHLELVSTLCDSLGFRLVLLFQHLRDAGSTLLGGGRATLFMRLGNYEEAERAANFIGRGYRFELARITTEHGHSDTATRSTSRSGEMLVPWPRRWGSSRSRAVSTSWSYAETSQRVQELFVEPTHLQALPPTAFLLVQHVADQRVLAVAADCNPDLLSLPRVSTQPLPDPARENALDGQPRLLTRRTVK